MNRPEKISGAIGLLDEDIIEEADRKRRPEKKRGIPLIMKALSAAACIGIIAGVIAIAPHGGAGGAGGADMVTMAGTAAGAPAAGAPSAGAPSAEAPSAGGGSTEETSVTAVTTVTTVTTAAAITSAANSTEPAETSGPAAETSESITSEITSGAAPEPPPAETTAERVPVVIPADRRLVTVSEKVSSLSRASYPKTAQDPEIVSPDGEWKEPSNEEFELWWNDIDKRREAGKKLISPNGFYRSSAAVFLSGDDGKNRVYSPVNVYMALAMLAETAGGESRYQILDLLGEKDIASLRGQAKNMWDALYRKDGTTTSVLANSLWLDDGLNYDPDTAALIAENYLASVYGGDLSSEETQGALKDWLNEQTGGLLKDSVNKIELPPETLMTLCSTVYFRAKWSWEFFPEQNDTKLFHGRNSDTETEFMNSTDDYKKYYFGDDYGAIELIFSNGGTMWFILPDEDKTTDDVLTSGEYLDMVGKRSVWEKSKDMRINYSVPKFDISSDTDLTDSLKKLGITDVFDENASDFSPLTDDTVFLGKAQHSARVAIDEKGCTAAAFTILAGAGAGMPPEVEEMDFILDRPFIFVIASDTDQPLFIGTVNQL